MPETQLKVLSASVIIGAGEKIPASTNANPEMNAQSPANGRNFLTPTVIVAPKIKYDKCENSIG